MYLVQVQSYLLHCSSTARYPNDSHCLDVNRSLVKNTSHCLDRCQGLRQCILHPKPEEEDGLLRRHSHE